jgi:hypothetical protein
MTEKDPLDGFRGRADINGAQTAEAEYELRDRLGPESEGLVDLLIMSELMEDWINADPVGKLVYSNAKAQVDRATRELFAESDVSSTKAADAHFRGRVAIAMLQMIEETLQAGRNAAQAITAEH